MYVIPSHPNDFTIARKIIRQLAILTLAAACLAESPPAVENGIQKSDPEPGQRLVYNLLSHIYENSELGTEVHEIIHDWEIEAHLNGDDHKWQDANRKLSSRYTSGMLPRGRIFSVFYPDLLEEAILIFKAFYHAPSYEDLIGVVYWAHNHLNEYQFNYALYVALVHSPAIQWIPIRQPYQIEPEFFFNTDVMQQVYDYKMGLIHDRDTAKNHIKIIEANFTNWYIKDTLDREYLLAYFMEDIGLSTWYYYFHLRYPFWMSGKEYQDVIVEERGRIYFYMQKTLLNIYRMKRLSHDLDDMDFIDWDKEVTVGYSPQMTYRNGMHFPGRTAGTKIPAWKFEDLQKLREFESRVTEAADSGYIRTTDGKLENFHGEGGFNKFSNLVQGNVDSMNRNYYGSVDGLSRRVIGFSPKPQNHYQILPSALEHFATSFRDPAFYRLMQRSNSYFIRYNEQLPRYTEEELAFEGVRFESVDIVEEHLTTYTEQVDTLIETLTYTERRNVTQTTQIKVRQNRLNHKPYSYKLNVVSEKDANASIRIFVGPKCNVYGKEISANYENFYQIDYFLVDLKQGENTILRHSDDHAWDAPDHISSPKFDGTLEGAELITFYKHRFGFPQRLILPRGKIGGLPVQYFFYVGEYVPNPEQSEPFLMNYDRTALGYPLDRPISNFNFPNMYFLDTLIYHQEDQARV